MGKEELKGRKKWQDYSGAQAAKAENDFFKTLEKAFEGTDFEIRPKPNEFSTIYVDVELDSDVLDEIYTPDKPVKKHGISPDYAIDNTATAKTLYVEVKRQDGWIEGGKRSDGRGNAHERSCKYFTPGLLSLLREKGKHPDNVYPFWTVFIGDITRDPCRVREITCWYKDCEDHFFLWRKQHTEEELVNHFMEKLSHLLV